MGALKTGYKFRGEDCIQIECEDCGRWCYLGKKVLHSSRCEKSRVEESPEAAEQETTAARPVFSGGWSARRTASEDEDGNPQGPGWDRG